jgi:ABC-type multidrug transport system ATPase subunit
VLFLDEPTTGLDPHARTRLWDVVDDLVREGTTVLLTSQYLEEVDRLADDIVVIDGGKVVAHGSAADLKRRLSDTVTNIRFDTEADARRAAQLLGQVGVAEVVPGDPVLRLAVPDSGAALLEIVRVLDAGGPPPRALTVHEPTLDDVFLRLTVHRATPEPDESDVPGAGPGSAATEIPSAPLPSATKIPGPGKRPDAAVRGGT